MNTPATTGALLARDKVDRYRPFGAFGKPAYQSHVQLRAMLLAKKGPRFANYFAKPMYAPDLGELRWTSEVPGVARGWHEMSPDEQGMAALELESIRSGLLEYATELRSQGGGQPGGATAYASLLEQATMVPSQGNFLHFVDDQPVISFWGFETQAGDSVDASAVVPAHVPGPGEAPNVPFLHDEKLVRGHELRRKRPWWWLLWLLLALLLLLLVLLGVRACTSDGAMDIGRIVPGMTGPEAPTSPSDPSRFGGLNPEGATGPGGTTPGGTAPDGAAPSGSVNAPAMPPDGADSAPGSDPIAEDPNKVAEKEPLKDPTKPDFKEKVKDLEKDKKAQTDPPIPKDDPKALKLPQDPKSAANLGFLEGKWKAGEGLYDNQTKQPLDMSFSFGKDGKGEITMRRQDGSTCNGGIQGRITGGKLAVDGSQSIPCSNGGSYAPPKIECAKQSSGQTQCYGINPDGSRYFMGVQRQP